MTLPLPEKFSSRKEWEKICWEKIKKSEKYLDSLVTANERKNIVIRAAILELLNAGMGPREISRKLSVSRQTISTIKKSSKEEKYKSYWIRSKTERRKKVYSISSSRSKKSYRKYRRTKYGKVYVPY